MNNLPIIDDYNQLMKDIMSSPKQHAISLSTILYEEFHPQSVIDIGCGAGIYLPTFLEKGVDILGIDGCLTGGEVIEDAFQLVDLRLPWTPPKRYDLALCIEVAEHLPEEYAEILIDTICASSDVVYFTAAKLDQAGTYHWNCQPKEYWVDKFVDRNYFVYNNEKRKRIFDRIYASADFETNPWVRDNAIILERR
jgi:hypothetical protein